MNSFRLNELSRKIVKIIEDAGGEVNLDAICGELEEKKGGGTSGMIYEELCELEEFNIVEIDWWDNVRPKDLSYDDEWFLPNSYVRFSYYTD